MTEDCMARWNDKHVCSLPAGHESPHYCYYIQSTLIRYPHKREEIFEHFGDCIKQLTLDDIPPQTFQGRNYK